MRHSIRENFTDPDCNINAQGVDLIYEKMREVIKYIPCMNKIKIISSPYKRTRQTASEVGHILGIEHMHIANILHEINGEEDEQSRIRCANILELMKKSNYDSIIVTHGGVMNVILKLLNPRHTYVKHTHPSLYVPRYTDFIVLDFINNKWNLVHKSF